MENHQRINQDSGETDYYTPPAIVEAARRVMGGIDLDPASSAIANAQVKARTYFTRADDGLRCPWWGRVWLNHPFSKKHNPEWIKKIVWEYEEGTITAACCITYASTSEKWFAPLLAYPIALISPRVDYLLPDGRVKKGVTKGSCVTYLGDDVAAFAREFNGRIGDSKYIGRVFVPLA